MNIRAKFFPRYEHFYGMLNRKDHSLAGNGKGGDLMKFFQTISEVNKESVKAILDNISMREEYVRSLIDDLNIPLEEITSEHEQYFEEELSEEELSDMSVLIHNHFEDVCYKLWGTVVGGTGKELDVHMAAKLLIFCMFMEVDKEEGHILADEVLVALIRHLLTDRTEADKIENLFLNINKWYS